MTVQVDAIATLWEDLLARSPLPPRVGGFTGAEFELARLMQGNAVRTVETPASETWIWSGLRLRPGVLADRMLRAWTNSLAPTDLIIYLGDVAPGEAFEDEDFVARVRACPGRRLLVLGNDDAGVARRTQFAGFEDQVTAAVTATDPPIALTHVAPVHALAISTGCAPGRSGAGTSAWT